MFYFKSLKPRNLLFKAVIAFTFLICTQTIYGKCKLAAPQHVCLKFANSPRSEKLRILPVIACFPITSVKNGMEVVSKFTELSGDAKNIYPTVNDFRCASTNYISEKNPTLTCTTLGYVDAPPKSFARIEWITRQDFLLTLATTIPFGCQNAKVLSTDQKTQKPVLKDVSGEDCRRAIVLRGVTPWGMTTTLDSPVEQPIMLASGICAP